MSKASSTTDSLSDRVKKLERSLRPADCRIKEVTLDDLYWELYTEHGGWLTIVAPKYVKKDPAYRRLGHPRWF